FWYLRVGPEVRDHLVATSTFENDGEVDMSGSTLGLRLGALIVATLGGLGTGRAGAEGAGLVFEGGAGPGQGKHIVLVAADDEYRSEESIPQLAKILARRHGFRCTVLFAIDKED